MTYLLHHLLTESSARFPEKAAARFQGQSLTYAELDRLSNQIARTLLATGIQRGDRIGIYVHKSMASVISVFGIMKAGGVYVPLDPSAPTTRLAYITRNCNVKLLLSTSAKWSTLTDLFKQDTPLETIVLTDSQATLTDDVCEGIQTIRWDSVKSEDGDPVPDVGTIETDLAYILYTSGSTGDPKGVMISHRNILTFVDWCYETFQVCENDRMTSHAPLHFDLSTFDIYVTIKAGGTIVLLPETLSVFPARLVKLLQDERITITYLVPSILSLMVNYGKLDGHDLSALRTVLFAGEVFPVKYLRQLVAEVPHADYYNLYGPTETNVCTYYKVKDDDVSPERTQPVPIGTACQNIEVFAVNAAGQIVNKPGEEGELWVRGSCVAQGYWGDPKKTAEGFVRNPFQPHFDEIAYRTGDIVTLHDDGRNWVYVGRLDHMIKSRGYRIELGEIESTLYGYGGVKEAAVVAIPDDLVGNRIKAFLVPADGQDLEEKEIQTFCSRYLPRYMIPELIEFREHLPKTSTGKVDRSQLALD